MPREIVSVQIGQCGNQVGSVFWEMVSIEHKIRHRDGMYVGDNVQDLRRNVHLQNASVYWTDVNKGKKWIPRAICVDLEPGTLNTLKVTHPTLNGDDLINGTSGAGNNWAKGHYTEGAELVDQVIDRLRKKIEGCDCAQGFQFFHSLGGGTGSGMGTLILLKVRDNWPEKMTLAQSVFPSKKISDTVVEPYNAVLSTHQLLENADECNLYDNEALFSICKNMLNVDGANYKYLNNLIAQVNCGMTASMRFPGVSNQDLRKLGVNLVPFPRLHFFLVAQAPLLSEAISKKVNLNVKECVSQCVDGKTLMAAVGPKDGKSLACSLIFRGAVTTANVDEEVNQYQTKCADQFVEWIPQNVKSSIVGEAPPYSEISATFISNSTSLKGIFQRLATQFGQMYKRKAFLHWYKGEGMDEMEFQEADKNVRDLITEYQDKQDIEYNPNESAEGSEKSQHSGSF